MSGHVIHVDRVIRLDWEPVQMENGDIEQAMALAFIMEVAELDMNERERKL